MQIIKYARKCSECGCGMNEGYVIDNGKEYYCSKECLHQNYSEKEWIELHDSHFDENNIPQDGGSYWTEWDTEDDDEMLWVEVDGVLISVEEYDKIYKL